MNDIDFTLVNQKKEFDFDVIIDETYIFFVNIRR